MPAVAGGTGFVGFGDYQSANQQATQNLANQVESKDAATNAADQLAISQDASTVASQVDPYLQAQAANASANDPNPANTQPTVSQVYSQPSPGVEKNQTTVTSSPYQGLTQQQANYYAAEPKGGLSKQDPNAIEPGSANTNDPNNPYSANNSTAISNLEANPNGLAGYGAFQGAQQQQLTDQQQQANENTWGGAFGALQSLQTPNAAGAYGSASGTGTGFDASLVQGDLGAHADAAQAAQANDSASTTALNSQIASAAGQVTNPWLSQPAPAPVASKAQSTIATPNTQTPVKLPTNSPVYPGRGFGYQPTGGTY